MSARHLSATDLLQLKPEAECCDCALEVDGSGHEEQIWTIWNGSMIYCPKCAQNEGVGPE